LDIPFELHVALRYLLARRKQASISISSLISVIGVSVGVMAVIIALALMTGLQAKLNEKLLGASPHIYVWKQGGIGADYQKELEKLRQLPHVIGAAPEILGRGLMFTGGEQAAVEVKGIVPSLEVQVTDVKGAIRSGSLELLEPQTPDDHNGVLLGKDLASKLGVSVGDSVSIITAEGTLTPFGQALRQRTLRVAGIISLGLYELDTSSGYVTLDVAKRLFAKSEPEMVQLRVDDLDRVQEVADSVRATFGSEYVTQSIAEMNRSLFSALRLEKLAIALAISLIVVVAALNIVASLILLVMEKHRDIAILKTMGASARSVTSIFVMEGVIIGLVGTAIGAVFGYALATVVDRYELIHIPEDVYMVSYMPLTVLLPDLLMVVGLALLICFVATIYPSRQAARLDPAQALRYE
jgi:lipoprotein-releasing system permease protein